MDERRSYPSPASSRERDRHRELRRLLACEVRGARVQERCGSPCPAAGTRSGGRAAAPRPRPSRRLAERLVEAHRAAEGAGRSPRFTTTSQRRPWSNSTSRTTSGRGRSSSSLGNLELQALVAISGGLDRDLVELASGRPPAMGQPFRKFQRSTGLCVSSSRMIDPLRRSGFGRQPIVARPPEPRRRRSALQHDRFENVVRLRLRLERGVRARVPDPILGIPPSPDSSPYTSAANAAAADAAYLDVEVVRAVGMVAGLGRHAPSSRLRRGLGASVAQKGPEAGG